MEDNALHIF